MRSGCVWLARSSRLTSPCRWQCAGPHGTFYQPKKRGVDSSWAVPFGLPKDLAQPVAMPNGSKVPGSEVAFHLGFPVNCREAEELGLMSFWPTFFGLKAVVACGVRRFRGAVVECPNCRAVAPEEAKFCQECGSPLPRSCPSRGSANRAGAKFCPECGASLVAKKAEDPKRVVRRLPIQASRPERRAHFLRASTRRNRAMSSLRSTPVAPTK